MGQGDCVANTNTSIFCVAQDSLSLHLDLSYQFIFQKKFFKIFKKTLCIFLTLHKPYLDLDLYYRETRMM